MFGDCFRKELRSCAGVVDPPSSSCGTTFRVEDGYDRGFELSPSAPSPSERFRADADGP